MTMAEPANPIDLGPPARRLAGLVARIPDEDLTLPTPCPSYALGDLIEHVGGMAIAFAAAASKERDARTGQAPPGDAARLGALTGELPNPAKEPVSFPLAITDP